MLNNYKKRYKNIFERRFLRFKNRDIEEYLKIMGATKKYNPKLEGVIQKSTCCVEFQNLEGAHHKFFDQN